MDSPKNKRVYIKCEHGKRKYACKDCHGSSICIHDRLRYTCKECHGGGICIHDRRKISCKECHGCNICIHDIARSHCKECHGSEICKHDKRRSRCRECHGGELCIHDTRKSRCIECRGSERCVHGKLRYTCKECHGNGVCVHNKFKTSCADCNGSRVCKSRNDPYNTGCRLQGNRKLGGFCAHCFVNIFPDDSRALNVRKKSKEIRVVTHILSKFDNFIHDKPFYADLEGGCCDTKRRIDLRKLINNTMLCIEIDEDQHKSYIKANESIRYDDLFMDFSGKYIFLRYNPDKFVDKYGKCKNPFFDTRMEVLEQTIARHIHRIENDENIDLLEIHHIFYDENV